MSRFNMDTVMNKYENGRKIVCDAIDTAKGISIHPKLNASVKVKSRDDGEDYFDGSIRIDKEFSLLKLIYTVLAVIAAFAAAAVIVNAIFSAFDTKKCCKKTKKCKKPEEAETIEV